MPRHLTPLFHTRIYANLTERQRLRYNQLHALYFNEQIMFFETTLANTVLSRLISGSLPPGLKMGLQEFMAEEAAHSEMFRKLNRLCAPHLYSGGDFHFVQAPKLAIWLLRQMASHPKQFPFFVWLMLLQEERALWFGRSFLQAEEALEPAFLAVQRLHLADEAGHVRWDEALLDWLWPRTAPSLRWINVQLLKWMLGEFFSTPKRSAIRVARALPAEFPDLKPVLPEMIRQLRELEHDHEFRRALYCDGNVPKTLRRFDAWPELQSISRVMPGYIPSTQP